MLIVYYENDKISVSYDEELQLGMAVWKGFVGSKEFRATALRMLDFVTEHGITRWLSDRRHMKAIRQQDQQWTVEEFIPKMLKSPLQRMATVVSEDIFNKMAIEQMLKRSGGLGSITLRDFDNIADAMEWLSLPLAEGKSVTTPVNT